MNGQIRQGDILLIPVKSISGRVVGKGKRVLAYGEVTGHSHILDGDCEYFDNGNGLLVAVRGKSELIHEEHGIIDVPIDNYLIVRQREFDIIEGIRKVSD